MSVNDSAAGLPTQLVSNLFSHYTRPIATKLPSLGIKTAGRKAEDKGMDGTLRAKRVKHEWS